MKIWVVHARACRPMVYIVYMDYCFFFFEFKRSIHTEISDEQLNGSSNFIQFALSIINYENVSNHQTFVLA